MPPPVKVPEVVFTVDKAPAVIIIYSCLMSLLSQYISMRFFSYSSCIFYSSWVRGKYSPILILRDHPTPLILGVELEPFLTCTKFEFHGSMTFG